MNRRKYLATLGVLGSGTAAAMGTGAFTSASASRDVSVSVADDTNGYLGLSASNGENGEFASVDNNSGGDGEIALDFDASDGGGSGVGLNSTYNFDDVFRLENQGTQTIYVWANFSGEDLDDDDIWFYPGSDSDRKLNDGSNSVVTLTTGQQVNVGVHIDTSVLSSTDDQALTATLTADVDVPGGSQPSGPVGEDVAVVSKDPDEGEYSSIQEAINSVDGTTVLVESGRYEESVTIDVDGLTLKAADGASPTVDGQGEIPVLVDGVDNVTVDDENIEFLSGIDVGHDFSDYEPEFDEGDADIVVPDDENSIGDALYEGKANTDILVKSDYDSNNESPEDLAGSDQSLISILHDDVRIVSEGGPEETGIGEEPPPDRTIDIEANNVVVQGFSIQGAQEAVLVKDIDDAKGIEIRDNDIEATVDGFVVSTSSVFGKASIKNLVVENNKVDTGRLGISFGTGGDPGGKNATIERNTVTADTQALTIVPDGDDETDISGNLVEDSGGEYAGVAITADIGELRNNHFINTEVSGPGGLDAAENFFGTEVRSDIVDDTDGIDFDPFAAVEIDPDAGED